MLFSWQGLSIAFSAPESYAQRMWRGGKRHVGERGAKSSFFVYILRIFNVYRQATQNRFEELDGGGRPSYIFSDFAPKKKPRRKKKKTAIKKSKIRGLRGSRERPPPPPLPPTRHSTRRRRRSHILPPLPSASFDYQFFSLCRESNPKYMGSRGMGETGKEEAEPIFRREKSIFLSS